MLTSSLPTQMDLFRYQQDAAIDGMQPRRMRTEGTGERSVSVESGYEASISSIIEYLLTDHPYGREIAQLSNHQIERLRAMLHEAIEQRITPEEIYKAISRGFNSALTEPVPSPPLANDMRQEHPINEKELMEALLREISPA